MATWSTRCSARPATKTTGVGGPRGYNGGKKISGRGRHLLVDTPGLVLRAVVHGAGIADRGGIKLLLPSEKIGGQRPIHKRFPRLAHLRPDGGYNGAGKGKDRVEQTLGWTVEGVKHPPKPRGGWAREGEEVDWAAILPRPGFRGVLPRRRVVERTQARLGQNRRLSKDFERLCATGEALLHAVTSRPVIRRPARA